MGKCADLIVNHIPLESRYFCSNLSNKPFLNLIGDFEASSLIAQFTARTNIFSQSPRAQPETVRESSATKPALIGIELVMNIIFANISMLLIVPNK